jgi:hypothetical protein
MLLRGVVEDAAGKPTAVPQLLQERISLDTSSGLKKEQCELLTCLCSIVSTVFFRRQQSLLLQFPSLTVQTLDFLQV